MRLGDLERHLRENGAKKVAEGAKHTKWRSTDDALATTVPRHSEIGPGLVRAICRQLGNPNASTVGIRPRASGSPRLPDPQLTSRRCLQTTVARFECAGVTVSVGIAPSLSATRCERALSGEIRETSGPISTRFRAQSRIAAAASVAYPRPQNARVNAQPSSA